MLTAAEAIKQLTDARSPKRRSAAKRLRKLQHRDAGPALVAALQKELKDPRTWETQYQLVMAIAECDYRAALPLIEELADREFEATMVYVAIGDALVRLSRTHDDDASRALSMLDSGNDMLIDGALRAVAMLRMVPDELAIRKVIQFVGRRDPSDGIRFWVAAAAAGWREQPVKEFLTGCLKGPRQDVREAAEASLKGKYRNWNPL